MGASQLMTQWIPSDRACFPTRRHVKRKIAFSSPLGDVKPGCSWKRCSKSQRVYSAQDSSSSSTNPLGAGCQSIESQIQRAASDKSSARHVCKVASSDPRDFCLRPVLKPDVPDVLKRDKEALTSGKVQGESAHGGEELLSVGEAKWSRENSILWSLREARTLISRYSQIESRTPGRKALLQEVSPGGFNDMRPTSMRKDGSSRVSAAGSGSIALDGEKMKNQLSSVSQLEVEGMTVPLGAENGDTDEAAESIFSSLFSKENSGLLTLAVCGLCYLHCSAAGFAVPALLPEIGKDIPLSDAQGALLTTGYTLLYASVLIPMGVLADRVDRPKLLAGGVLLWSAVSSMVAKAGSFGDLMTLRVGFALSSASQNPICMSLLPEIFPKNKSTAMAVYNCAIYMGRALSFGFVMLLAGLGVSDVVGVQMVPLDSPDLDMMSILYTTGDKAAVLPIYDYNMNIMFSQFEEAGWRDLLFWLGVPGIVIAAMLVFLVKDPRGKRKPYKGAKILTAAIKGMGGGKEESSHTNQPGSGGIGFVSGSSAALVATHASDEQSILDDVMTILDKPSFQATTFAAAMNDVGGWALIAWQAIFYERVFDLPSEQYAPILALLIPLGGITGGVGGGLVSDWLSKSGNRFILTFGASLLSAPLIYWSFQSESSSDSFFFLLFGFALSECWRAPAAVMVREVSPESMASTASAVHLCIRNVLAGLGPIGIAILAEPFGLQNAMTLIPVSYMLSAIGFLVAEVLIKLEEKTPEMGTEL